jgi:hypothetical protein
MRVEMVTADDEMTTNAQHRPTRQTSHQTVTTGDRGHPTKKCGDQDTAMTGPFRQTRDGNDAVWTSIANINIAVLVH